MLGRWLKKKSPKKVLPKKPVKKTYSRAPERQKSTPSKPSLSSKKVLTAEGWRRRLKSSG